MTKNELIAAIHAQDPTMTKTSIGNFLDALSGAASATIGAGRDFKVPGVARVIIKHRKARTMRNPKTGEPVQVAAKTVLGAKADTGLGRHLA